MMRLAAFNSRVAMGPGPRKIAPFSRHVSRRLPVRRYKSEASQQVEEPAVEAALESTEACFLTTVQIDNTSDPLHTLITVECLDYPGLLRVITWVLNGNGVVIESADLSTGTDSVAFDRFWVTDERGRKLSDKETSFISAFLKENIASCTPKLAPTDTSGLFHEGNVVVDNQSDPKSTIVYVYGERNACFTQLCSALTGIGLNMLKVTVTPCADGIRCASLGLPAGIDLGKFKGSQMFRFDVQDNAGRKLEYARCSGVLWTLGLLLGTTAKSGPLHAPQPAVFKREQIH